MTRTITPAEVKPGMRIRWESEGITRECTVAAACTNSMGGLEVTAPSGGRTYVWSDSVLTVLMEAQPEEPTAFGARVVADGMLFVRADDDANPWRDVCALGPVTIIDADPSWTLPAQVKVAPVVPERIEEWPKNDEHLRAYEWQDRDGRPWVYSRTHEHWYNFSSSAISKLVTDEPQFGPWTRVTDA